MKASTAAPISAPARKAWRALLAAAGQTLGRRATLMRHQAALLPRFATYYTQIAAMPRRVQRRLLRRARLSLAGFAFLCAIGQAPAFAQTTIYVNDTCTLADAIRAANDDAPSGGCPAGSGHDTIVLPANTTFVFDQVPPDGNLGFGLGFGGSHSALPRIQTDITIEGNGSTLQRRADAPPFRILAVFNGGNLTLNNTAITGGVGDHGGGILVGAQFQGRANTATLNHCTVRGNSAPNPTRPGLRPGPRLGRWRGPYAPRRSLAGAHVRAAVVRQRVQNSRRAPHNELVVAASWSAAWER